MLLARRYSVMPHVVADLPFAYYLSLRDDFFREKMAERRALAKAQGDDDVIEFDADAYRAGDRPEV